MAMKPKGGDHEVPQQQRFPEETAANQMWETTAKPVDDANATGMTHSYHIPSLRTVFDMNAAGGEFNFPSKTDGRKKG